MKSDYPYTIYPFWDNMGERREKVSRYPSESVAQFDQQFRQTPEEKDERRYWRRALAAEAERDALRIELEAYRDSVRIDVQMDGPKFMGCNISQLRRAYEITRAALNPNATPSTPTTPS